MIYVTSRQHLSLYDRKRCHTSQEKLSTHGGRAHSPTSPQTSVVGASALFDKEIPPPPQVAQPRGKGAPNLPTLPNQKTL